MNAWKKEWMNQITSKPKVRRPEISIQYDHDLSWGVSGTLREHSAVKWVVTLSDLRSLSNVVPITFGDVYVGEEGRDGYGHYGENGAKWKTETQKESGGGKGRMNACGVLGVPVFAYIISIDPHRVLSPIVQEEIKKLNNLPKVSQQLKFQSRIWTQASHAHCRSHHSTLQSKNNELDKCLTTMLYIQTNTK